MTFDSGATRQAGMRLLPQQAFRTRLGRHCKPGFGRPKAGIFWSSCNPLGESCPACPPATVILAKFDSLRSESASYAKRFGDAGVEVEVRVFPGVTHEFFGTAKVVVQAKAANDMAVRALPSA